MAATLEQRLSKLEAANRRMRRLLVAIGVALGLGVLLGQAEPRDDDLKPLEAAPHEVVTKNLRIVDAQGKNRIECTVLGDMPVMKFYDSDGIARISMLSRVESSSLEIADKAGAMRASIGHNPSGPGVMFMGDDRRPRAILSATKDGPGLLMFDADRPRVLVGVRDNEPVMAVLNRGSNLSFGRPGPQPESPPTDLPIEP